MTGREGRPKEILDTPSTVQTPTSSRRRRSASSVVVAPSGSELIVIASAHFGKEVHSFAHRIFERYVCFNNEKIGQASAIYDENLKNLL